MYRIIKKAREKDGRHRVIFVAALLLAFHYYLIAYVNSSFLGNLVDISKVSILYAVASLINIFIFLKTPSIIRKYGSYKFVKIVSIIEILALLSMALIKSPPIIILAFVIHHSVNSIILSCLDMYLEDNSDAKHMGKTRGTFLTILSIAAVSSPLAIGSLVQNGDFTKIYLFSIFFMVIFLLWIIRHFKKIPSGQFREVKIVAEVKEYLKNKKIKNVTLCHILLQFFYSWMIIYIPVYLVQEAMFSLGEASIIISISLLPFLLFEIPIGEWADRKLDEREIIAFGFLLSALILLFFPIIPKGQFILWTIALFLARTGASLIETATESYFFRNIKGKDELIEIFRISSPSSFIVGPLVGGFLILLLPFKLVFIVLSFVMFLGIFFALRMEKNLSLF